jgi:hypothetical protein
MDFTSNLKHVFWIIIGCLSPRHITLNMDFIWIMALSEHRKFYGQYPRLINMSFIS